MQPAGWAPTHCWRTVLRGGLSPSVQRLRPPEETYQTQLDRHKKGPQTSPPPSPGGWWPCARVASSCKATFCCTPPTSGTAYLPPRGCLQNHENDWQGVLLQPPSRKLGRRVLQKQALSLPAHSLPTAHAPLTAAERAVMQVHPGHEHTRSGGAPHSLLGPARGQLARTACRSVGGLPSSGALPACLAAA